MSSRRCAASKGLYEDDLPKAFTALDEPPVLIIRINLV